MKIVIGISNWAKVNVEWEEVSRIYLYDQVGKASQRGSNAKYVVFPLLQKWFQRVGRPGREEGIPT